MKVIINSIKQSLFFRCVAAMTILGAALSTSILFTTSASATGGSTGGPGAGMPGTGGGGCSFSGSSISQGGNGYRSMAQCYGATFVKYTFKPGFMQNHDTLRAIRATDPHTYIDIDLKQCRTYGADSVILFAMEAYDAPTGITLNYQRNPLNISEFKNGKIKIAKDRGTGRKLNSGSVGRPIGGGV